MRLTGGSGGGRRIAAPRGVATRPTAVRARRGLFDHLAGRTEGARVLDLCAGSGALGLEALSRGAAKAILVDRSAAAVRAARVNAVTLGVADRAEVWRLPADRAVRRLIGAGERFDLVLADPPYADWPRFARLPLARLCADGGVVALEHRSGRPPQVAGLVPYRTLAYGDVSITLARALPAGPSGEG
jgi:16S rRNA (guanine966-N2)-methyltransferase